MQRRSFLWQSLLGHAAGNLGLGILMVRPMMAAKEGRLEEAARVIESAIQAGQVRAACISLRHGDQILERPFGEGITNDSPFLLGSISKPMVVTAFMSLVASKKVDLEDPVRKYLPEFDGEGREKVRIRHLLTHTSGLPDQLPENGKLRKEHARLDEFVRSAMRLPLAFEPGTKYEYSSMAILLAAEIAQRISGRDILELTNTILFARLNMTRSALGLGTLKPDELVAVQTEHAAPEAGGGDPKAKEWDWNSRYWRGLGAPWGGVHSSAKDVRTFIESFSKPNGSVVPVETARSMVRNHNPIGLPPRGLGFGVGPTQLGAGLSLSGYGHTGSTGTLAWHDPEKDMTCVILTSLPGQAVHPHPRETSSLILTRP